MTEQKELPRRITAGPCSKCGVMLVGANACPHCGNKWIGTRVNYIQEQPAEDERVKEIWARCRDNFRELGNDEWRAQYRADVRYLLSLPPVQLAQTVDLSLLPYEIAEELPKIGGEFGKLASMCKSHVASFIEKLISERANQPAASTPTEREATIEEAARAVYRKYGTNLQAFWRDAFAAQATADSQNNNHYNSWRFRAASHKESPARPAS